jgi:hypothetical protein
MDGQVYEYLTTETQRHRDTGKKKREIEVIKKKSILKFSSFLTPFFLFLVFLCVSVSLWSDSSFSSPSYLCLCGSNPLDTLAAAAAGAA